MLNGWLVPDGDKRQRLRIQRTVQAIGGALMQSLIALFIFFADGFRLSATVFALLMTGLWLGHLTFYLMIRQGFNRRFADPSMTQAQVVWAIFCTLILLFFMARYRFMLLPFLPLTLMFGAFKMTSRQYAGIAVLIVAGYCAVVGGAGALFPETFRPDEEILGATVFVLIILAFSLVGNEISRLRRRLHWQNVELAAAAEKMSEMAITDELTGLINRRQMMFVLGQQKAQADRGSQYFSVCFFDIDHFKSVNDTFGHHVGDVVLKRFAEATKKMLRASDLFARFGGEEFVLLATGADLDGAAIATARIRKVIRSIDFSDIASALTVTLSAGITQYRPKEEIRSVLTRADKALYLAKNSGRNCIKLESDL